MDVHIMIMHLKKLFDTTNRTKRYETFKKLVRNKMTDSSAMNTQILKIIDYIEKLSKLGFNMRRELSFDLVL